MAGGRGGRGRGRGRAEGGDGSAGRGAGAPAPASLGARGAPLAAPLKVLGSGRREEGAGACVERGKRRGAGSRGGGAREAGGSERGRAAGRAPAAASVRGAETPSAELSATKSHNGQLFLLEGLGGGSAAVAPTSRSFSWVPIYT